LKPEWWGAPLVQEEKYQGKGTCDKYNNNNNNKLNGRKTENTLFCSVRALLPDLNL
jgi:hypothetical protein